MGWFPFVLLKFICWQFNTFFQELLTELLLVYEITHEYNLHRKLLHRVTSEFKGTQFVLFNGQWLFQLITESLKEML